MKNKLSLGSVLGIGLTSLVVAISAFSGQLSDFISQLERKNAKQAFSEWYNQHPFAPGNQLSADAAEELPKYDRPDLARQQDFLWTLDPALGYPPRERLLEAQRIVEEYKSDPSRYAPGDALLPWEERGPNNVGGRTRALMWDPNTTNKVWAAGVGGGLWYNNDITTPGTSWNNVDDFWTNIAISCIAFDPSNTQVFYVGTGEGWYNADALQGLGVWKTTDGGST